jgi:hypothetical protein
MATEKRLAVMSCSAISAIPLPARFAAFPARCVSQYLPLSSDIFPPLYLMLGRFLFIQATGLAARQHKRLEKVSGSP